MTSEGHLFRIAYGALDRLAPTSPDFADLGAIKLSSTVRPAVATSRWMMGVATAGVVAVVALVPVILLGPGREAAGGPGGSDITTTVVTITTTSMCPIETTTVPPSGGVEPLPPTTTTISPESTSSIAEGLATTSPDPCLQTDTTAPPATTTIPPPTTTSVEANPDRNTIEEVEAFLFEFLLHMREGSYELARVMYGGEYTFLIERNPEVDAGDRSALLAAGCQHQLLCDLTVREVISVTENGNLYTFLVTLQRPDGSQVTWNDQEGISHSEWEFQVINDNGILRSLSLPLYLP